MLAARVFARRGAGAPVRPALPRACPLCAGGAAARDQGLALRTTQRRPFSAAAAAAAAAAADPPADKSGRQAFGKLGGRAPKGTRTRKPRPARKKPASVPAAGTVSASELRALCKELGWDDEMIKNPDLLDILLVESARRQEDAARLKDTALYSALAKRLETEFKEAKSLWNDTGGFGNNLSQFKPASAVRGPPPKSAKTLGAEPPGAPKQGDPIVVDLSLEQPAGEAGEAAGDAAKQTER